MSVRTLANYRVPLLLLAGILLSYAAQPTFADDDPPAELRFRRVFAPEDRLKNWPLGNGKYLPIDADEFDRMIEAEQSRAAKSPLTPGAAIVSARYEAKLVEDHFAGQASANIVLAGAASAMLPFEPCNLAIRRATWGLPGAEPKSPARAALGLAGDGKLEAVVEQSGELHFEWSLGGRHDSADILGFLFELPGAPANELIVELPKALTPSIDHGMIVGNETIGDDSRRWHIELGGCQRFRMRILPAGVAGHRPQLALLRESRTYDFSPRGVEIAAQWRIEAHNEPLQQITALLDPGLQLVSARDGDAPIPWSVAPANGDSLTRIVLTLPEPIRDSERVIRLSAIGQPVLDKVWRLPSIRAQGLFWQEGTLTLLTPEPLLAERIVPFGCNQTGTGPLSAPRAGESVQLQAYEPDATVELLLSRRAATMQATTATALELGGEEVAARVASEFRVAEAARFTLEADVSRQWIIDTVESTPSGAVADWTVDPGVGRNQLLTIRLGNGLSPAKSLRLTITARRLFAPSIQKLSGDDLFPVRFRGITDARRLVALRAAASYALRLSGDEQLRRLRPDRLASPESELFAEPPRDVLFEYGAKANALEVALAVQKAQYSGTIQIDATVGETGLRENFEIRCAAQSGRVDRVLVELYPRRDKEPRWSLDSDDDQQVSARKWSDEEQQTAGVENAVEIWDLALRRPRSAPFVITAVRELVASRAQDEPLVVSLVALPEAATQRGTVTVRSAGPKVLQIENHRLKPILPEPLASDRAQSARGVYCYDPTRDVAEGAAAALRVSVRDEPTGISAWVYNCSLESWYQSDGTQLHQATYDSQNSGRGPFRLLLPPGVVRENIRGVWIDGEPVEWHLTATENRQRLAVELPARRKFPIVTIQWTTTDCRLAIVGSIAPPLPEPELPMLARRWTVWLPPGFECVGADSGRPSFCGQSLTWSRRLFGPLGRDEGMDRFDPLSAADWMTPFDEYRAREPASSNAEADVPTSQPPDMVGWTAWRTDLPADNPPSLEYTHCTSMRLLGAIAFLLCIGLGRWKGAGRPALLVALLGAFAAAALLVPVALTPITSGTVLGILFCLAWRIVRPQTPPPASDSTVASSPSAIKKNPGSTVSMAGQLGLILIVALLTFLLGNIARGEDPPKPSHAPSPTYRVFVPIDAQKKPSGTNVYVPEPFYQELYRRNATPAEKPKGWLIVKANYRGTLAGEPLSGRMAIDTLRAEYDLQVFGRATRVRIPLRAEGANLIPNGVLLDGRPIQPEWEPDVAALAFEVAQPGEYRLEVSLRPTVHNTGGPIGIDIGIPRVVNSHLELALPDNGPRVEAPTALGNVTTEKSPPRLLADLGPTDRLSIRWHDGTVANTAGPAIDVEQFTWLKFQPGSVVIATKFKLRAVEGQIQQVQLAVDPRLRLLPLPGADAPVVQTGPETGQARLVALRWARPFSDPVTLDATFILSGATGVGNFRVPKIELLDARPTKRWIAVSVDSALDREEQQKQKLETVPVADFLKVWGPADTVPLFAYRLPAGEPDWSLSTRPHEPRTTAEQAMTLSCDEDHADLLFEAQLATTSGYLFQYRVAVPEQLKISDVSLLEDDVDRASRWSRDPDGSVAIFLNGAASGPQKLILKGELPIAVGKPWPLPRISIEHCQILTTAVRLFRQPPVLVTLAGDRPPNDAAGDAPEPDWGRLVEAFAYDTVEPPAVTVITQPNRPEVQAETIVWPEWQDRAWNAKLDCKVSVSDGVVDEIEIRAPAPWNGPYQANPPGQIRSRELPGDGRRLFYRPQTAISGDFRLTISGPLQSARGNRPTVPDIALLRIDNVDRWFLLPTQAEGRAVRWQRQGLRPTTQLPHLPVPATPKMSVYEASVEPAQAVLEPAVASQGVSFVRLADVTLNWAANGACYGAIAFDVEPGGADECPLLMPANYELVQASVEGIPVVAKPVGDRAWRFPLTSQRLPQRVEVLFRGHQPGGVQAGPQEFTAPSLGDLPVRQTLWTVAGPPSWSACETDEDDTAAPWQQNLLRLKSAAAAIDSAFTAASDDSDETSRWYPPWARRFAAAHGRLQSELNSIGTNKEMASAKRTVDGIVQQNNELAKRLGTSKLLAELSKETPTAEGPGDVLRRASSTAPAVVRCAIEGQAETLTLDCRPIVRDRFSQRLGMAAGLILLAGLAAVGLAVGRMTEPWQRWPHITGVLIGLAWWLWLSPSIVGLGIALASVLAAGHSRMPAKGSP